MQKEEERKFKEVGEAFSVLSDAKKKSRYDSGQDLEDDGMNMGGKRAAPRGGWLLSWHATAAIVWELTCFVVSRQISTPTTFSRRSLAVREVLVLKVT